MRLIDAEAAEGIIAGACYRASKGYAVTWEHIKRGLDAAPTVECAACECGDGVNTWDENGKCVDCYCASNFKRRQS